MDEGEIVRRIRNSLKIGRSEAVIIRKLQGEGYRLEYIEALIRRARGRRLFFSFVLVSFLLFITFVLLIGVVSYVLFLKPPSIENKVDLDNPLDGFKVNFNQKEEVSSESVVALMPNDLLSEEEVFVEDIEITSDFISYLLNELGFWQLRSNPLSGDVPLINFRIDGKNFNSVVVDNKVTTNEGLAEMPDLTFVSNKEDIILAMLSNEPAVVFRDSYSEGGSSFVLEKSEAELFAKGYMPLYNSFNS